MSQREMINVPDWIRVVDAEVPPDTEYWRLTKVEYWNDQQSGGTHHIYIQTPHDPSAILLVSNGQQSWPISLDKPHNEPAANFAMWGGNHYSAHMDGLPSDRIEGMHMPSNHHVSYLLWWERTVKQGVEQNDELRFTDVLNQECLLSKGPVGPLCLTTDYGGAIYLNKEMVELLGPLMYQWSGATELEVNEYQLYGGKNGDSFHIVIERSPQISGPDLWAVHSKFFCLNKAGTWQSKRRPSERNEEFIKECRFSSPREALLCWNSSEAKDELIRNNVLVWPA